MKTILASWRLAGACLLWLGIVCVASTASADPLLTVTPTTLTLSGTPGQTFELYGAIINRTPYRLSSSDLMLDFYNFDPLVLNPTPLLGSVDFSVDSFHVFDNALLFSLDLSPDAAPGSYSLDLVLQDVYGNLSDPVTLSVQVVAVPEPAMVWLLAAGLALALVRRRAASKP